MIEDGPLRVLTAADRARSLTPVQLPDILLYLRSDSMEHTVTLDFASMLSMGIAENPLRH